MARDDPVPTVRSAWDERTSRRFLALAGARAGAQALGLAWFFVAARSLPEADYGELATGLAFFAVFAGIGDLGTTRGVVRHVAADNSLLQPVVRRAVAIRVAGGLAVGLATAAAIHIADVSINATVVLLAGLVATASGVSELAYSALRSIGRVRTEVVLLVAERAVFLVIGTALVWRGGGAVPLLIAYLATNVASSLIGMRQVHAAAHGIGPPSGRSWSLSDAEARSTAVGFALVTVSPRISAVLLALLATPLVVADFSVAHRPIEAMTLFALSTAAPLLPIARERLTAGNARGADQAAVAAMTAIGIALAPFVGWLLVSPRTALDLFFGTDRYDGAALPLQLLAITALTWSYRGVAELVLLAQERAGTFLVVTATGVVTTLVVGPFLIDAHGAAGAAAAVVAAEVVMTAILWVVVPSLSRARALRSYVPVLVVASGSAVTAAFTDGSKALSGAGLVAWAIPALALAIRSSRRMERTP